MISRAECRLRIDGLKSPYGGPYSLSLDSGDCVVVRGASGSGKSVFLRLLADLDPHDGDVWLDGIARSSMAAPEWRRQVVYQAAEPAWWAASVRAHLAPTDVADAIELLPALALQTDLIDAEVSRLSTGERQRMALIRSLACKPRVLLLDEPTAALDPASTLAVEAMLASRRQAGLAVIFVTHSSEQALRVATRQVEVRDHRIFDLP